jgi:hypothetical protein
LPQPVLEADCKEPGLTSKRVVEIRDNTLALEANMEGKSIKIGNQITFFSAPKGTSETPVKNLSHVSTGP